MDITFRTLRHDDSNLLEVWLNAPHVREWWHTAGSTPAEELAEALSIIDEPEAWAYIVATDGREVGYIQCYNPFYAYDGFYFADQPKGSRGVDMFIGEADLIGKGLGTQIIKSFCDDLLAQGAPKLLIDPDPANLRAVRAYENAGFVPYGEHDSPEYGRVLLMSRTA